MCVLRNRFRDYSFTGEAKTPVLSTTMSYLSILKHVMTHFIHNYKINISDTLIMAHSLYTAVR